MMGYLNQLADAIMDPATGISGQFLAIVPKVIITAIVIMFGYLLGWLLGSAVRHALARMKFDDKFRQLHIAKPLEKIKISSLLGWVVKWYTFIVFVAAGADYISLEPITLIMNKFAQWFPNLLIAMAIGLAGAVFAEYVYKMVMHISMANVNVLANIARYFILVVVVVLALDQIIDVSILGNAVLILIAGISAGIALAVGIAFGLALKDEAAGWVGGFKKK
jgi:hypothetical protein